MKNAKVDFDGPDPSQRLRRPIDDVLARLKGIREEGAGFKALCPAHDDRQPSLSIAEGDDGRVLLKCFAGCAVEKIVMVIGLEMRDLFPAEGITLAQFAEAKNLPIEFLRSLGLEDAGSRSRPAVRIPYLNQAGEEVAVRFRTSLQGPTRFRWKKGSRARPYGLQRVSQAQGRGQIVLCEGESDALTLWYAEFDALGLPGAGTWRPEWADLLDGIANIFVVIEPDRGGEAVLKWLAESKIRDRARLVSLEGAKDPSELYLKNPAEFGRRFQSELDRAVRWAAWVTQQAEAGRDAAWAKCQTLAGERWILDAFVTDLHAHGVAGEERAAKLVYLVVCTRFQQRPVSAVAKALSSTGKSFIVQKTLDFFPPSAYYALTAMSERALAYSEEPIRNRFLILFEAAGIQGEFGTYLVRSLLSEARVRYETVEKSEKSLKARFIEREGPTGLLITTTATGLDAELETRLFSIPMTESPEQTKEIMRTTAREDRRRPVDLRACEPIVRGSIRVGR